MVSEAERIQISWPFRPPAEHSKSRFLLWNLSKEALVKRFLRSYIIDITYCLTMFDRVTPRKIDLNQPHDLATNGFQLAKISLTIAAAMVSFSSHANPSENKHYKDYFEHDGAIEHIATESPKTHNYYFDSGAYRNLFTEEVRQQI